MKQFNLTYFPINQYSLIIQWPKMIDKEILDDIISFKFLLENTYDLVFCQNSYQEILLEFKKPIQNFEEINQNLQVLYSKNNREKKAQSRIHIPVCYEPEFGLDLIQLSYNLGLSSHELIRIHTEKTYTLFSLGFLPGFMYLGGLDQRLHFPRKANPRQTVPKGAVGIGGNQTGIYPQESPGGWQIIGNSPINLFNIHQNPPFVAKPGDEIRFFPISKKEYELIQIQAAAGIYPLKKEVIPC